MLALKLSPLRPRLVDVAPVPLPLGFDPRVFVLDRAQVSLARRERRIGAIQARESGTMTLEFGREISSDLSDPSARRSMVPHKFRDGAVI
ncbi:hypothetical protein JCM3766R1_001095 [Sporobolomyces carnicolor]